MPGIAMVKAAGSVTCSPFYCVLQGVFKGGAFFQTCSGLSGCTYFKAYFNFFLSENRRKELLGQRQEGWKLAEAVFLACKHGSRSPYRRPFCTRNTSLCTPVPQVFLGETSLGLEGSTFQPLMLILLKPYSKIIDPSTQLPNHCT